MGALTNFWEWITGNPVARQIGVILLAVFGVFAGYKIWKANVENGVRRQEREKTERERLEEQVRVDETRREINTENQDAAQRAEDAVRELPHYRHTDELRNADEALAAIVLGPDQGRGG